MKDNNNYEEEIGRIEKLELPELTKMADDTSINVPATLVSDIQSLVGDMAAADRILGNDRIPVTHGKKKITVYLSGIAAGLIIVFGISFMISKFSAPTDTFKDPQLAYAEVERVIHLISVKMSPAHETIRYTEDKIRQQVDIFKRQHILYDFHERQ